MARFELTLRTSFRRNRDHWPHEFRAICDGLAMALAHLMDTGERGMPRGINPLLVADPFAMNIITRKSPHPPLMPTFQRVLKPATFTGTIPIPDQQAEQFEAAFRAIPDVIRVQRVA